MRANRSSSVIVATLPGKGRSWRMASGVFCATASTAPRSAAPATPVESPRKSLRSTHRSCQAKVLRHFHLRLGTFPSAIIARDIDGLTEHWDAESVPRAISSIKTLFRRGQLRNSVYFATKNGRVNNLQNQSASETEGVRCRRAGSDRSAARHHLPAVSRADHIEPDAPGLPHTIDEAIPDVGGR